MFNEEISVPIEEFEVDPSILGKLILVKYENLGTSELCLLQVWPDAEYYCFYSAVDANKQDVTDAMQEFWPHKNIEFITHTGDEEGTVFDIEKTAGSKEPYYLARVS